MICIEQSWTTNALAATSQNEQIQKSESLSSLLISETSSENSGLENVFDIDNCNTSISSSFSNNLSNSNPLELEHDSKATHNTQSKVDSFWSVQDHHHATHWDHALENDVFESSTRKRSIDSMSSSSSRKSQHKLKIIIDWVQKNGRRASVKCQSLKRKASFPLNDTKKLHSFESEPKCLDEVLSDKENLRVFREFLARELSDENLDFWLQVESYRKQKSSKRIKTAQKIFDTFVATSSNFEINIDSCIRKQIQENLQQAETTLFDVAQTQIYQLMERDSFRRFSNKTKVHSQA